MNDVAKRRLKRMMNIAEAIKADAETTMETISRTTSYDDLMAIETLFESMRNAAQEGYDIVMRTYDELEEE